MSYLDGLLKALETVRSYGSSTGPGEINWTIRAIVADLEFEIARYHRNQESIRWLHV
jgi:hypothetical protein